MLGVGLVIRSRVGGVGGSGVQVVGHLAREKRARRLGSAAPYPDYLLIHHAAGRHHLSFHALHKSIKRYSRPLTLGDSATKRLDAPAHRSERNTQDVCTERAVFNASKTWAFAAHVAQAATGYIFF